MRFSLLRTTKRGSLELSTNAIVVIVLAFVMLGLGLSIIRTLGNNTSDAIPKALGLADLEQKPTADMPLTVGNTVKISANTGATTAMNIGYYNADSSSHTGVYLGISQCLDPSGVLQNIDATKLPKVTTLPQDVAASTAVAFNAIISNKGLPQGTYLCSFDVGSQDEVGGKPVYREQITLQVTS